MTDDARDADGARGLRTVVCPWCGGPPVFILDDGHQAFCGADDCPAICWDMFQDVDTLLRKARFVSFTRASRD